MLYFTLPLILSLALLFTQLTHPLSMGLTLLTQTILVCLLTGTFNTTFWFSYILFLIFLGGMLILFIYIASLASNESFQINFLLICTLLASFFLSLSLMIMDPLTFFNPLFSFSSEFFFQNKMNPAPLLTNMIYSLPSSFLVALMISYLLLTLLVVVKIINISSSPLRPSTN
uniref:NADH-ubiquinone oxidoreductase chain 6 n=1 Tax=Gramastacus insolitus TaxID=99772 RepID=A0A191TEF0_9EUCA|nr:NADH dehydrogenase subunit 6 [Gramastacus insolitus]ANI86976.1 NADH dehydrogenase subunit 6 [Gramastacus insolitus]